MPPRSTNGPPDACDRATALVASGRVDLGPFATHAFSFDESVAALRLAAQGDPDDVELQIEVRDGRAA